MGVLTAPYPRVLALAYDMSMLTAERLRSLLNYDPVNGNFTRLVTTSSNSRAGNIAGCYKQGYRKIIVDGNPYQAHRLAWLWMTGEWPRNQIDHINLNGIDNQWCNLREATKSENALNSKRRKDNSSGFKGVNLHTPGVWRARLHKNGKKIHLGLFDSKEDAHTAYAIAATNHFGEYARTE